MCCRNAISILNEHRLICICSGRASNRTGPKKSRMVYLLEHSGLLLRLERVLDSDDWEFQDQKLQTLQRIHLLPLESVAVAFAGILVATRFVKLAAKAAVHSHGRHSLCHCLRKEWICCVGRPIELWMKLV